MKTIIISVVALFAIAIVYAGTNLVNYTKNSNQLAQFTLFDGKVLIDFDIFSKKITLDIAKLVFPDDQKPTSSTCAECKKIISDITAEGLKLYNDLQKVKEQKELICISYKEVDKKKCKSLTNNYNKAVTELKSLNDKLIKARANCEKICLNVQTEKIPTLIVTCSYSPSIPTEPTIGTPVTFFASVKGGIEAKTYTWKIDGKDFDFKEKTTPKIYSTSGMKNITLTVVSGKQTQTATCPVTIKNPQPVITTPPPTPIKPTTPTTNAPAVTYNQSDSTQETSIYNAYLPENYTAIDQSFCSKDTITELPEPKWFGPYSYDVKVDIPSGGYTGVGAYLQIEGDQKIVISGSNTHKEDLDCYMRQYFNYPGQLIPAGKRFTFGVFRSPYGGLNMTIRIGNTVVQDDLKILKQLATDSFTSLPRKSFLANFLNSFIAFASEQSTLQNSILIDLNQYAKTTHSQLKEVFHVIVTFKNGITRDYTEGRAEASIDKAIQDAYINGDISYATFAHDHPMTPESEHIKPNLTRDERIRLSDALDNKEPVPADLIDPDHGLKFNDKDGFPPSSIDIVTAYKMYTYFPKAKVRKNFAVDPKYKWEYSVPKDSQFAKDFELTKEAKVITFYSFISCDQVPVYIGSFKAVAAADCARANGGSVQDYLNAISASGVTVIKTPF